MPVQLGVVGKPNTGKSTFFAAATLIDVKRAPYPFTTINPNIGVGYVRLKCVCKELGVKDNPRNSICINGWRFAPIELIDVAGLVPGAWEGRGLGNMFLDHLRRAPALLHVVDAAGATDEEGRPIKPGSHDPMEDVVFLEREIAMWMYQIVYKDWERVSKLIDLQRKYDELYARFSGLGIKPELVQRVIDELGLQNKRATSWSKEDVLQLVTAVRERYKPIIIVANKADLDPAEDNIKRMIKELGSRYKVIPTSAEAELALKKAAKAGLIEYIPGESDFKIIGGLKPEQERALEYIREKVFKRWGSTGVQNAIDTAVFDVLGMIAVFPVENEKKFTDHQGNVLPDVLIVPGDTTARGLAYIVHTDLGENFVSAIDARSGKRVGADERLSHRMVIKIVARA
ncbi:redox-regulated ATPase YchF [Infirmifilum lucidum]|uniref:Redox-regulated ATPase YchF n=1 Tax=Infirmifilum lucidum TaxID=2776706 RepID=A0A7L9FIP2_9CREN|nr:redox-regulated ATPase YchF [Infirmifilum lucidum]QOJ79708.1 redox-regulated ATPase YchF [Infirmifilum lucidum]